MGKNEDAIEQGGLSSILPARGGGTIVSETPPPKRRSKSEMKKKTSFLLSESTNYRLGVAAAMTRVHASSMVEDALKAHLKSLGNALRRGSTDVGEGD